MRRPVHRIPITTQIGVPQIIGQHKDNVWLPPPLRRRATVIMLRNSRRFIPANYITRPILQHDPPVRRRPARTRNSRSATLVPVQLTALPVLLLLLLTPACLRKPAAQRPPALAPDISRGWIDITPNVVLKIENAYFKDGAAVRDISTYLGTELLSLKAAKNNSLLFLNHHPLPNRPPAQPPVLSLLPEPQRRQHHHRFYFQVVVNRLSGKANAVLLTAPSPAKLEQIAAQLQHAPASLCTPQSPYCTVFPDSCSVSLAMEVTVNNKPTTLLWGTTIASQLGQQQTFSLLRRGLPVTLPRTAPLLPGDSLSW